METDQVVDMLTVKRKTRKFIQFSRWAWLWHVGYAANKLTSKTHHRKVSGQRCGVQIVAWKGFFSRNFRRWIYHETKKQLCDWYVASFSSCRRRGGMRSARDDDLWAATTRQS